MTDYKGANQRAKRDDPGFDCGQVSVVRVAESGLAALFRFEDHDEIWLPFSQIHATSELNEHNCVPDAEGKLVVTQWIAKQKGLAT